MGLRAALPASVRPHHLKIPNRHLFGFCAAAAARFVVAVPGSMIRSENGKGEDTEKSVVT
jgi:hypothetical protein